MMVKHQSKTAFLIKPTILSSPSISIPDMDPVDAKSILDGIIPRKEIVRLSRELSDFEGFKQVRLHALTFSAFAAISGATNLLPSAR